MAARAVLRISVVFWTQVYVWRPKGVHTISFEGVKILRKLMAHGKNLGGMFLGPFH
jgi:hypothetical protein